MKRQFLAMAVMAICSVMTIETIQAKNLPGVPIESRESSNTADDPTIGEHPWGGDESIAQNGGNLRYREPSVATGISAIDLVLGYFWREFWSVKIERSSLYRSATARTYSDPIDIRDTQDQDIEVSSSGTREMR